jgi:hypothetical protein
METDQGREPEQVLAQATRVNGPCPGLPFCDGMRPGPEPSGAGPFPWGAIAGVFDTWTATWYRRFSGGSPREPGAREARQGFPRLEPDGWLVRISAPKNGESGRATGAGSAVETFPHPPQIRDTPGRGRCGELTRAF